MGKRILIYLLIFATILSIPPSVFADNEYVGDAKATDVVTYINGFPIPSYNFHGYTFIKVEDLSDYGFDVPWNEYNKSLRIIRNGKNEVNPKITFKTKQKNIGKTLFPMHKTNIKTYIGNYGYEIECLAGEPGYTYINVDNLSAFGKVDWVASENALKIVISDGLESAKITWPVPYDPSDIAIYNYRCDEMNHYFWGNFAASKNYEIYFSVADLNNQNEVTACSCDFGTLYVEIIDTEGKSVYNSSMNFYTNDYSMIPYCLGVINTPASLVFSIPNDKIRTTANDGRGLVKIYYWCNGCRYGLSCEYHATDLPIH